MSGMSEAHQETHQIAESWLADQQQRSRDVFLIVDRLAEPDPIAELFERGLMQDYVNLYQLAGWAELESIGPWLVRISEGQSSGLSALLHTPHNSWGWLASAEQLDLATLTNHWQDRLLIEQKGATALYRFQDNRVIGHHLQALTEPQLPLLLGPLQSVLCWYQASWQITDNPNPGCRPRPFERPWLDIPEPVEVQRNILAHNVKQWLWTEHPVAVVQLAALQPLDHWLNRQLDKAEAWGWHSTEQQHFLVSQQLDPAIASHPAWVTIDSETPEAHYQRCYRALQVRDYS